MFFKSLFLNLLTLLDFLEFRFFSIFGFWQKKKQRQKTHTHTHTKTRTKNKNHPHLHAHILTHPHTLAHPHYHLSALFLSFFFCPFAGRLVSRALRVCPHPVAMIRMRRTVGQPGHDTEGAGQSDRKSLPSVRSVFVYLSCVSAVEAHAHRICSH